MKKAITRLILSTFLLILCLEGSFSCFAASDNSGSENNYRIVISDEARLFTPSEITALKNSMEPIIAYGNAACVTVSTNEFSAERYASDWYYDHFGTESGIIFLIDMNNRVLTIYCEDKMSNVITNGYATSITDNVYRYASNENYYSCATQVFSQALTLLEGEKIMQPMKYTCNALLAILLSLLVVFAYIYRYSRLRVVTTKEIIENIDYHFSSGKKNISLLSQEKTFNPLHLIYNPDSDNYDYDGGSPGGGGGFSGGGSHDSGGGSSGSHRF